MMRSLMPARGWPFMARHATRVSRRSLSPRVTQARERRGASDACRRCLQKNWVTNAPRAWRICHGRSAAGWHPCAAQQAQRAAPLHAHHPFGWIVFIDVRPTSTSLYATNAASCPVKLHGIPESPQPSVLTPSEILRSAVPATPHQADESGPTASELADRIKALKAANTFDAAPQRVQRKHSMAEEPITARIRRRQEAMPTPDQAARHDERPAGAAAATPEPNSSANPMTFQERILRERNGQTDEHTPE